MWTFIPLLATKDAWQNRTFKVATHTFQSVLDEIKTRKDLRGQIILNTKSDQDIFRNYVYSVYENNTYIDFNTYAELERILCSLKITKLDTNIRKLYLYNLGYFVN
jgi:hypothetical protein